MQEIREILDRATRPNSALPRPFLRWAGSKRLVLCQIADILPRSIASYHEPFLGSGALFFLLQPQRAVISDLCQELINTFSAVRDNPRLIATHISHLGPDKATFYALRANPSTGRFKRAAHFIYLNKVCWNGLYRVNSRGQFNVPYGQPKSPVIADPTNLMACSNALRAPDVRLSCLDFEENLSSCSRGDLAFLDPPYVTSHSNNGFVDYNEKLFSWADQVRLAKTARRLAQAGVHVVVCNADDRRIRRLYPDFGAKRYHRHSTLSSNPKSRVVVSELILFTRT
jgi:DNA adenine methylase